MRKVHTGRGLGLAVAACLALGTWPNAQAVSFRSDSGDWSGSWDTTLGYGQGWRVSTPDCRLIATANGGCGYSANFDNGDLNYLARAAFTEVATGVTEFALNYKEKYGLFVRASGLYDFEVMDDNTDFIQLSHAAKDYVGSYTRLLDAFGYWRFNLGSMPSELRAGRMVVDWGESTFIPGGLNSVDYFDTTALVVPGSELKQALLPDEMVTFNTQLTKNLSTQLLYLFDWHEDIIEPNGAYFSTSNFAGPGGTQAILPFGTESGKGVDFTSLGGGVIDPFQAIPRLPDQTPPNAGQYGLNFKLYLPNFGQGTNLGLYFLNYTSRLPVVSAVTGSQAGFGNAWGAVNAVGAAARALPSLGFQGAVALGTLLGQQAAKSQGGNLSAATAAQYAAIGANTLLATNGNAAAVNAQATSLATNEYAKTEGLVEQFPQDIKMIGLSFNTQIQKTGTALQGEIAYRHDLPVQIDDVELIYASLTPFESGLNKLLGNPVTPPGHCVPTSATPITGCNQLGAFGLNQTVQGWTLEDAWHGGFTATQVFANVFKASQAVLLFEAGADYYPNLQSKLTGGPEGFGLRYDGPGTFLSGNPNLGGYPQFPAVNGQCVPTAFKNPQGQCLAPGWAFADKFSWGYVVAGNLEYDNVIAEWNLKPHFFWSQDVTGVSPGPGGDFVSGRYAYTIGLGASLHNRWELDVSYTQYGGAGGYNLLNDRDFIAASIKVSF
ncbi:MAG TPA: DUF1302 domain-containing protein [Steroidobacteraceae bacterium]|jgi:hypothetical protein|nr:DUF1302 domain-containing protein [Steroidobacteraceae bacterium]